MDLTNGYYKLPLTAIKIDGEKAAQFLHGQLSNSIKDLALNTGNYNLLLTHKGKLQADLFVLNTSKGIQIWLDESLEQVVLESMSKLAPLSRCKLYKDKASFHHLFQNDVLPALELDQVKEFDVNGVTVLLYRSDRFGVPGFDLCAAENQSAHVETWLKEKGFKAASCDQVELVRIQNGVAKMGADVNESNLPQEGRLERALHFNKGCYLGQEVVARLEHRGHVNKLLVRLKGKQATLQTGAEITSEGKACGRLTSVALDGASQQVYALGYVSYKLKDQKEFVVEDNVKLRVF